jgi:hypothetical protein
MPPTGSGSPRRAAKQGPLYRLGRRRGLVIAGALAAGGTSLAVWQHWLTIAELSPLFFTLPCAAMMFGCMKGMNHRQQPDTAQSPPPREPAAAGGRS